MKNRLNRDWQIERKQMQDELLHLREENAQLKDLLCQHGITIPQSQKSLPPEVVQPIHTIPNKVNTLRPLTPKEKIDIFRGLFRGREDVFARRWYSTTLNKGGYQPVCQREWDVEFCNKKKYRCANCPNRQFAPLTYNDIYCHLQGKDELGRDVIGLYVVMQDNTCYLLCADFDDKSCEHGYKNDVLSFTQVCQDWGIPYAIERSRSGNGAHVWIFFDTPILASKARKLGFSIISEAMNRNGRMTFRSYDRFFPNQDRLPEGGLGNLVALPLQGKARHNNNSVFVDEHFEPHFDQWAYLLSIKRLQETIIDDLIAQHGQSHELGELTSSSENKPWELPKQVSLSTDDFLRTIQITCADRLYIPLESISSKLLNHLKRIAAFKNPDFYNRLAMRLSIQNTPRIISCADVLENYIALPRGCEDAVFDLLQHWLAPYEVQDKTNAGRKIPVEFVGELRDDQQHAISTLRNYNNGVLSATTAFGKTVAVAALIAKRKVNTLILVHSKALLLQWKSILERFLLIDAQPENTSHRRGRKKVFSPIGCLSSDGNTLHGIVDIAIMQSCFNDHDVKSFVQDYGMVVVDECHHVPAFNFEQVLKHITARYVYGLTATPIRKDGHQPIIFMQCGPIRYSSDAKQQIQQQTFSRILVPRFTSYRFLSDEKLPYARQSQLLAEDEVRNNLIVQDIKDALNHQRTPIVLSDLTSHVLALAEKIQVFCPNVITLLGADSAKGKRETLLRLQNIPITEPLVIVATGKYIGEGFDYPRLDTLFLAMPISWKGRVAQYAGRLHRVFDGKKDVQIYDYIDVHVPVYESMYRKRLRGYAAIGYIVQTETKTTKNISCSIFNGRTYFDEFAESIRQAKHSVLLSCPKISEKISRSMLSLLQSAITDGKDVLVVTSSQSSNIDQLSSYGISVRQVDNLSIRTAVIDCSLIWYGGVNFFGYSSEEDNIIQFESATLSKELLNSILY